MAHFLCHLGCSHFGALLLDFYFTENTCSKLIEIQYKEIQNIYGYFFLFISCFNIVCMV